jgi:hypothetical protein
MRHQAQIGKPLGSGHHGSVYGAERNGQRFAVKFCKDEGPYFREVRAYESLLERGVKRIEGFAVPQFLGSDDELLTIEMSIVQRPFLLDFGGAYEEEDLPSFPENVWEEWEEQKREEFGSHWPIVENILMILRS